MRSRKSDLESIDENDSTFSTSVSSSLFSISTLLNRQVTNRSTKGKGFKKKVRVEIDHPSPFSQSLGLEPLPSIATKVEEISLPPSTVPEISHLQTPTDHEILTFRVEDDDEDEERDDRSIRTRNTMDCETPRVITWTDLSYDPNEYVHHTDPLKSLQLQSLSVDQNIRNEREEYLTTSRSDQSDYEVEWDRAKRKIH